MKTSLEHLPERKQREFAARRRNYPGRVVDLVERSSRTPRRMGRIFKIILFGSYARGTRVDERDVVVRHRPTSTFLRYRQQQGIGRSQVLGQGNRPADVGQEIETICRPYRAWRPRDQQLFE